MSSSFQRLKNKTNLLNHLIKCFCRYIAVICCCVFISYCVLINFSLKISNNCYIFMGNSHFRLFVFTGKLLKMNFKNICETDLHILNK